MTVHSFAIFDAAIGPCGLVWGERGISGVQLPMSNEEKTRKRIHQRNGDIQEAEPTAEVRSAIDAIIELLAGKPNDLSGVVLDLDGVPEFDRGVYDIARTIPPGHTVTRRRPGAWAQPVPDRGALSSRARRRQQAGRIFRQWRGGDETQNARDRGRGRQSHAEPVRLNRKNVDGRVGKANGSRERAPDDRLRVPTKSVPPLDIGGHGARRTRLCPPYDFPNYATASQVNPLPDRRIFPVEGEGKCAVQHSVSVSQ